MSSSHVRRIMDLKRSSPTPPDAPMKSRSSCSSSPSREELDTARVTGIHAFAAIMLEPKPFMPPNWTRKNL